MPLVYLIRLHLLDGIFYMCLKEFSFYMLRKEANLEWIDDNLCDIFFGGYSDSTLFKFLENIFICFRIFIILTSRINLTVLVPNLAARDALEIWEILATFFPPPERY